jgi:hypothetical protein
VAVRRLANPVTLCDGHGVFFVAASGQIRMAANSGDGLHAWECYLRGAKGLFVIGEFE